MKVNDHNFNKERNASFISAFLMMFIISIYFVHIPWNIDRLDISESELGFGLFVFGISNFFLIKLVVELLFLNLGLQIQ